MRTRRETVTYKLPRPFVDAHRDVFDAIDWRVTPTVTLDLGWPQNPVLEAVAGRGGTVIRPATIKSANVIRRSVSLPETAPDPAVLAARNPEE